MGWCRWEQESAYEVSATVTKDKVGGPRYIPYKINGTRNETFTI